MTMLPPPPNVSPLDPDEFVDAYLYGGMVMENEFLEEVPAIGTALIQTPDGTFGLTRHPANLFGLAVMRHFHAQPDKAHAFMWRFHGLQILLDHEEMKPYITGTGDEHRIDRAVLEVVATHKLSDNYDFEPKPFFQKVREVAARVDTQEAKAMKKSRDGGK